MNVKYLRNDIIAGIIVFLVAVPLCLGIALASGVPPFAGIIAGIIGGIIIGSVSGSPISVSGPAAGMVSVVLAAISALGSFENFLLALTFAGVVQIIIGAFRAGFIADFIPSNVIQGLLCAIGILIILKQLPLTFSHVPNLSFVLDSFDLNEEQTLLVYIPLLLAKINWGAIIISIMSFTLLIVADRHPMKLFKLFPAPIVAVLCGVLLNEFFVLISSPLWQDASQLVNIPITNNFQELTSHLTHPNFTAWADHRIYLYALLIAGVASLETVLNVEAAEKLDGKHRYTSKSRELIAQGIGNTISGLLGGLPLTSVVVRSSVNIQSGARSKLSTIIHGGLFVLTIIFIPHWLAKIPLATLASILIYVGYKLTKVAIYKKMYDQGFEQFFPFIVTVIAIIFTNLLLGIIIGLTVSIFFILKYNSQMRMDVLKEQHAIGEVQRILLPAQLTFLNKASLIAELNAIPDGSKVVIDARYAKYLDKDILEVIKEYAERHAPKNGIELNLLGFKEHYKIHNHMDFISVTTYDVQSQINYQQIITILKEGNQRFIQDQPIHRYIPEDIKATANTQHPLAVVLSCIDSRVPVETIFDMGMGDLFIIRIAGNIINDDIMGSLEFSCQVSSAKLIVVLGHTRCGAIKAACDHVESGHISQLLKKIAPAMDAVSPENLDTEEFLTKVTQANINNSIQQIYKSSAALRELIDNKEIGIVGALYDIRSGIVTFYEDER